MPDSIGGMGSMKISDVMDESRIDLKLKGKTKDEIIEELVDLFDRSGVLCDREQFKKDVYFRESEGVTGMGDGLAIPHGKSKGVEKTCIAIGRSQTPIEWESLDDKPIEVFVMMAVKDTDKSELVSLLSQIAIALCDENVTKKLFVTESPSEVIDLFK